MPLLNTKDEISEPPSEIFHSGFGDRSWLKKHGKKNLIVFNDEALLELRKYFNSLDEKGTGSIGVDELEDPFIALGLSQTREEVQELIDCKCGLTQPSTRTGRARSSSTSSCRSCPRSARGGAKTRSRSRPSTTSSKVLLLPRRDELGQLGRRHGQKPALPAQRQPVPPPPHPRVHHGGQLEKIEGQQNPPGLQAPDQRQPHPQGDLHGRQEGRQHHRRPHHVRQDRPQRPGLLPTLIQHPFFIVGPQITSKIRLLICKCVTLGVLFWPHLDRSAVGELGRKYNSQIKSIGRPRIARPRGLPPRWWLRTCRPDSRTLRGCLLWPSAE